MKFNTQFNHPSPSLDNRGEKSLARPEFADETSLINIVKRYQVTGYLVDPSIPRKRQPMFGDFTQVPTTQEAYNKLIAGRAAFESLPQELQRAFDYDPMQLLSFLEDPSNRDRAIQFGLIAKEPVEQPAASEPAAQAAQAAVATNPVA